MSLAVRGSQSRKHSTLKAACQRRCCRTIKNRSYASFPYSCFHLRITFVGVSRLGYPHGGQFHHRVQLVERGRAGRYLDQHAVVQHCARRRRARCWPSSRSGWRTARGLALCRRPSAGFPLYSRLVPVGLAIVAILFASASIDYWTVMRFFGSRGLRCARRCLEGSGFLAPALPFYLFDLPFYSRCAWLCVCAGDSLRPALLGHGPGMAVGGTDPLRTTAGWVQQAD